MTRLPTRLGAIALACALAAPATADPRLDLTATVARDEPLLGELDGSRGEAAVTLGAEGQAAPYSYRLAVTAAADSRDPAALRLDGTFLARHFGDFELGAGLVDRNWSPSPHTSLILSRNARPFPSVWFARTADAPVDLPLLNRLGPWRFELFYGRLEADRVVPHASMFGARGVIEPLPGLELGASRTAQWGGDGRPEDWQAFWRMLTGHSNTREGLTGAEDPANQLAGTDASYTFPPEILPLRLYFQAIGEDEENRLPVKLMYLYGAEWRATLGDVPSRFTVEYIDTQASRRGEPPANLAYNNYFYGSGYTYHDRVMGASVDTDGEVIRLLGRHEFRDLTVDWGLGRYRVNTSDSPDNRLSSRARSGMLLHLGAHILRAGTELTGRVVYQDFPLDRAGRDAGLGLSLTISRQF